MVAYAIHATFGSVGGKWGIMEIFGRLIPLGIGWPGGVMVKALACDSKGREFNSRPSSCRVSTLGKLFTHMCLCHQAV